MKPLQKQISVLIGVAVLLTVAVGVALAMNEGPGEIVSRYNNTESGALSLASLTVAPGEQVTMTVTMSGVTDAVYSADIVLQYNDSVVRALSVGKGDLVSTWSVASNVGIPGEVHIALAGTQPASGDGEIASIVFEAVGSKGMQTDVVFSRGDLNEGGVPVALRNGQISVGNAHCYDFDNSSVVDVSDIKMVAAHWRERPGDAGWDLRFDVNGDGVINVLDVLKVAAQVGHMCP